MLTNIAKVLTSILQEVVWRGIMNGYADIHSHILHCVDDGSEFFKSLSLIQIYRYRAF